MPTAAPTIIASCGCMSRPLQNFSVYRSRATCSSARGCVGGWRCVRTARGVRVRVRERVHEGHRSKHREHALV